MTGENIGSVFLSLQLDNTEYNSQLQTADNKAKTLNSTFKMLGRTIAMAFSITALIRFSKASLDIASSLYEVQNVIDTTFGENVKAIEVFAQTASDSYGLSELSAKKFAGTIGAMTKSMGLSDTAVLQMSTSLVGLAGDLASFYNLDTETAFNKIRSGISGETEPLKQLGINLSVANLEAYALSQGIEASYNSMSEANKAILRYNYLLSVTQDAQGDFAKTSDSMANQMRLVKLRWEELQASFGKTLILLGQALIPALNGVISILTGVSNAIYNVVAGYQALDPRLQSFIKGLIIGNVALWALTKAQAAGAFMTSILTKQVVLLGGAIQIAFWQITLIVGALALFGYAVKRALGNSQKTNNVLDDTAISAGSAANSVSDLTDNVDDLDKATRSLTPLDEIMNLEGTGLGQSLIGDIDLTDLTTAVGLSNELLENLEMPESSMDKFFDWFEETKWYSFWGDLSYKTYAFLRDKVWIPVTEWWDQIKGSNFWQTMTNLGYWITKEFSKLLADTKFGQWLTSLWTKISGSKFYTWVEGLYSKLSKALGLINKITSLSSFGGGTGLLGAGGRFANGGEPPINKISLVGEQGPELFVPKTAGTIIPNNQIGGASIDYNKLATAIVQGISGSGLGSQNAVLTVNGRELARATFNDFQKEGQRLGVSVLGGR